MTAKMSHGHAPGKHLAWIARAGFVALAAGCAQQLQTIGGGSSPVVPITGMAPVASELNADEQVSHVLGRLTFGPRPGDRDRVREVGVSQWMERQLHPETIPDTAMESMLRLFTVHDSSVMALVRTNPPQNIFINKLRAQRGVAAGDQFAMTAEDSAAYKAIQDRTNSLYNEVSASRVLRAQLSDRQLLEVMTDFWENHFSVFAGKMPTRFTLLEYDRDLIRPRALGKFRDLLGAVAKSPAMLFYLDNFQSAADSLHLTVNEFAQWKKSGVRPTPHRKNGPNENYGRELMELHTLGVDGGYSQQDVINVARALTGWTIDKAGEGGGFIFRPGAHDAEEKTVLGHRIPAGRGIDDGEEVLDIVARHPATARFIALKIARRLVADTPSAALVTRAAATFRRTDGDIREVVRTIITSPEFFSRSAYRAKVKTPFEYVVSMRRVLDALPDTTPRTAQAIARLGQPLWGKLTPNGWPDSGDQWVNTGAILDRVNFAAQMGSGRFPDAPIEIWPGWRELSLATFDHQVDGVIRYVLGGQASPDTRGILVSGRNPLAPAGSAANPLVARPSLRDLLGLALGSPEFQRR